MFRELMKEKGPHKYISRKNVDSVNGIPDVVETTSCFSFSVGATHKKRMAMFAFRSA